MINRRNFLKQAPIALIAPPPVAEVVSPEESILLGHAQLKGESIKFVYIRDYQGDCRLLLNPGVMAFREISVLFISWLKRDKEWNFTLNRDPSIPERWRRLARKLFPMALIVYDYYANVQEPPMRQINDEEPSLSSRPHDDYFCLGGKLICRKRTECRQPDGCYFIDEVIQ